MNLRISLISSMALVAAIVVPIESPFFDTGVQAAEQNQERKTRRTPALRDRVYSQLARAQKLADDGQVEQGLEILQKIKGRAEQLNSYERAMLWNFLAFIYYGQENIEMTVDSFKKVVAEQNIPESLEMSTLFSLAQLSMSLEKFEDTITYLDRWDKLATDKTNRSAAFMMRANAYYADKNYTAALNAIDKSIAETKEGANPKENSLVLKRALHYEMKQTAKVVEVTELLVRYYDKPKYWVELANLYGELGKEDLHLAVMEAAYQQGYIEKSRDFQTLAQLYFYAGAPYKAAKLLQQEIDNETVKPDTKLLTFLAQSWEAAHEIDKSIRVLKQAAELSDDHTIFESLARLYVELEDWQQALEYATKAEQHIKNSNEAGNVYVAKGIALLNLKQFDQSIVAFEAARDIQQTKRVASQWLRYVKKEQEMFNSLKQAVSMND